MNTPSEIAEAWTNYLEEEKSGVRAIALQKLEALLKVLTTIPTTKWHSWALAVAEQIVDRDCGIPVRFPLFREALFPGLLAALLSGNGAAARYLVGFSQLLGRSPNCLDQLPENLRTPFQLIVEAIRLDGSDIKSKRCLLKMMRGWFENALHELPTGVLFGTDGASIAECGELEKDLSDYISLSAALGRTDEDDELIEEASFHIPGYRDYLINRSNFVDYSDYLSKHEHRPRTP